MTAGAAQVAPARPFAVASDRRGLPGALLVSAATAASGALTYAFLVLAARALGPAAYGRIGVLWGAMFIVAIVVFRPLEQTTSQAIAARAAEGRNGRAVVRAVTAAAAVLVALVAAVGAATWHVLARLLFDGSASLTALLLVGIVLYGVSYVIRGVVGGVRWFQGYALVLIADSLGRLFIALPLVLSASTTIAAVAVVAAGACGAVAPIVIGRRRLLSSVASGAEADYRLRSAAAFAAPAGVVAACDQIVVNGPPLIVSIGGASAAVVGLVFAATMLLRAPVYVFQGLAASLLPNFTHLRGDGRLRAAVFQLVRRLGAAGVAVAVAAALGGPLLMRVLYGERYVASRLSLALLGAAVGAYLVAATLSQALLAARRAWTAAVAWLLVLVLFLALFALLPGEELLRVAAALAVSTAAGGLLLVRLVSVATRP